MRSLLILRPISQTPCRPNTSKSEYIAGEGHSLHPGNFDAQTAQPRSSSHHIDGRLEHTCLQFQTNLSCPYQNGSTRPIQGLAFVQFCPRSNHNVITLEGRVCWALGEAQDLPTTWQRWLELGSHAFSLTQPGSLQQPPCSWESKHQCLQLQMHFKLDAPIKMAVLGGVRGLHLPSSALDLLTV